MTTIVWPASLIPASADYTPQYDVRINTPLSGQIDTYGLPGQRWVGTIVIATTRNDIKRGAQEALLNSLRGGARTLQAPYFGRMLPNGTLRGTPTLRGAVAAGASLVPLQNCNGGVRAGDVFGLGGQLLMVDEDASPSGGNMDVKVSPAVRKPHSAGTAWVWNRPTCPWIPRTPVTFPYRPGRVRPAFSFELVDIG
ncbi:MAG TPA: hypothetical protein PK177_14290 [Burkholderiaceae bacterium]|nr:hypothetical protein [Burkholderiaceae bacterium]